MRLRIRIVSANPQRDQIVTINGKYTRAYFPDGTDSIPLYSDVVWYTVDVDVMVSFEGCIFVHRIVDVELSDDFSTTRLDGPFSVGDLSLLKLNYARQYAEHTMPKRISRDIVMTLCDGRMMNSFIPSFDERYTLWRKLGDDSLFSVSYSIISTIMSMNEECMKHPFMLVVDDTMYTGVRSFSDHRLVHNITIKYWCDMGHRVLPLSHSDEVVNKWLGRQISVFSWVETPFGIIEPMMYALLEKWVNFLRQFEEKPLKELSDSSFDLSEREYEAFDNILTSRVTILTGREWSHLIRVILLIIPQTIIITKNEHTRMNTTSERCIHVSEVSNTMTLPPNTRVILDSAELFSAKELSTVFRTIKRLNVDRLIISFVAPPPDTQHSIWIAHVVRILGHRNVFDAPDCVPVMTDCDDLAKVSWASVDSLSDALVTQHHFRNNKFFHWRVPVDDYQDLTYKLQTLLRSEKLTDGAMVYFPHGHAHLSNRFNIAMTWTIMNYFWDNRVNDNVTKDTQIRLRRGTQAQGVVDLPDGNCRPISIFSNKIFRIENVRSRVSDVCRDILGPGPVTTLCSMDEPSVRVYVDKTTTELFEYSYAKDAVDAYHPCVRVSILIGRCFAEDDYLLQQIGDKTTESVILFDDIWI